MSSVQDADAAWAIVWDSVLNSEVSLPTKVTSNPIATGSPINDHAYDEQVQITMTVIVSNAAPENLLNDQSLDSHDQDGPALPQDTDKSGYSYIVPGLTRSQAALSLLDSTRKRHELCDLQMGLGLYRNMFLTNIKYGEDAKRSEVLEAELSFVGINLSSVLVAKYRPLAKGSTSRSASLAKKRKAEGQTPSLAQQRQALKARLMSGSDDVVFDEDTAEKIAYNRYPDPPGQAMLVNGGDDP
jgi:hypothetical protein